MSVRLTIGQIDGRPHFTDVVGELVTWKDEQLVVRNREGELVEISEGTLVAGKVVPPAGLPRRRRADGETAAPPDEDAEANASHQAAAAVMEGFAARSFFPADTALQGAWLLRAAEGFSRRGNCVTPLGDPALFGGPELGLSAAITHVQEWYAARGLEPRFLVVADSPVDRELEQRGWHADAERLFMTAHLAEALEALPDGHVGSGQVRLTERPSSRWLWLHRGPGKLPPVAEAILLGAPKVRFAELPRSAVEGGPNREDTSDAPSSDGPASDGPPSDSVAVPVAIGRVTVDGDWAGLSAVEVGEEHRRQGHSRAILRALLVWASETGAKEAFLQVRETNFAAVALYEKLGFAEHHRYHFRTL